MNMKLVDSGEPTTVGWALLQFAGFVFLTGVAWATLTAQSATSAKITTQNQAQIAILTSELHDMSRDLASIRGLLCERTPNDSYCVRTSK